MLKDDLNSNQIQALKSGNQIELETLRYILSQIKNKEIERKSELTDEEFGQVIRKVVRELKESIESFEKGGRSDLIDKSKKQLEIASKYLPPEISDDELKKEIQALIEKNKELYSRHPKAIIGICMKELKGQADASRIMAVLNSL